MVLSQQQLILPNDYIKWLFGNKHPPGDDGGGRGGGCDMYGNLCW